MYETWGFVYTAGSYRAGNTLYIRFITNQLTLENSTFFHKLSFFLIRISERTSTLPQAILNLAAHKLNARFFFKRSDLNAGVDVRPKLQSFAMSCLLMSAVGLPLNVPSSYVRTGLLDESLELPCWGRSFGVADGPQQMLLMSNTISVILHHILQHLIHQHFAVLLHTITHTE